MIRSIATFIFVLAFIGIFMDRIMRGDFDGYSLIFVGVAMAAFLIKEYLVEKERRDSFRRENRPYP